MKNDAIIKLVIIGASTAFLEIYDLIVDINENEKKHGRNKKYEIVALLDDNVSLHGKKILEIPVVGSIDKASEFSNVRYIFAIGSIKTRKIRENLLRKTGIKKELFETLIHPNCKIYHSAKIGYGCIIHYGSVISAEAVIEDFVVVAFNTLIAQFSRIKSFAMITSNVSILEGVIIGKNAFIGTRSVINEYVYVGDFCVVGIGSVLSKNLNENLYAFGYPAKQVGNADIYLEIFMSTKKGEDVYDKE